MTTKTASATRERMARQFHRDCTVCRADDPFDLGLQFQPGTDGSMAVIFQGGARFQGYAARLHGGIITLLFDAAMTHCLFARGLTGVTAQLDVRFKLPVTASPAVTVRAWVEKQKLHFILLRGALYQDGQLKASAEAKFRVE